ncbi:MAG: LPS export ABC transporter permease LptF [Pseudomonadota bacterium]
MIISRYFAKEVYSTVFSVTLILVLVFLVNQTIRFLSQAATGHLASSAVLNLILLELPYLLGLLLPLGLYLGVLITYSRFYADQEMTVLFAAGMSRWQLLRITLGVSSLIFIVVCGLMFELNPFLAQKKNSIMVSTAAKNLVAALVPGTFKITQGGQRVIYVGGVSRDHKTAENLFVADAPAVLEEDQPSVWTITSASSGSQRREGKDNHLFIVAKEGYRYQGAPGKKNFEVTHYKQYGVELPDEEESVSQDSDAISSQQLISNFEHELRYATELQWRMALPISTILLAILAQLLSRVAPRQGRFQQIIPAILIYVVYANMMFVGRTWMSHGKTPEWLGLWWIHGLLVMFILFLSFRQRRVQ